MPAELTEFLENGVDLADKYVANTDFRLLPQNYFTQDGLDYFGYNEGGLWTWGQNNLGQLGQNNLTHRSSPIQVGALTSWKQIGSSCSSIYTAAIKTDGTLWFWGQNNFGQFGQNDRVHRSSPIQVGALTNWKLVAGGQGQFHTAAIKTDGSLWVWGNNRFGQLGQNDQVHRSSPIQVGALTNWKLAASGAYHVAAIKTDGTLWTWGWNGFSQLGDSTSGGRSSPVQVGALTNWEKIDSGALHTVAIKTDGTLWAWGSNITWGEIGDGTVGSFKSSPVQIGLLTNWKLVAGGNYTTAAIKTDGTLWAWGRNNSGELGDGTVVRKSSPVQVGALTNWKQISIGNGHTAAIKTDGTLWAWGNNGIGQLGQNDRTSRSSPIQVGALTNWKQTSSGTNHIAAIKI